VTRIDVALLPGQRFEPARSVCVVVDVLRASSSIVTLLERDCEAVVAAADIEEARRLHGLLPGHLLCGEKDGFPPAGFDYGNSPVEFSRADLAGRSAILATSNGTRVLAALAAESPAVLVGCLLNRTAVARAALGIAGERGLDIAVVCSAAYGGSVFVLEDALGAGAIADAALSLDASLLAADAARFAAHAFTVAASDIRAAVRSAYHAQELADVGLGADVAYCAQLDVSDAAPVVRREAGVLSLVNHGVE
jgi:2-phosphosulfolactate phosphatase